MAALRKQAGKAEGASEVKSPGVDESIPCGRIGRMRKRSWKRRARHNVVRGGACARPRPIASRTRLVEGSRSAARRTVCDITTGYDVPVTGA